MHIKFLMAGLASLGFAMPVHANAVSGLRAENIVGYESLSTGSGSNSKAGVAYGFGVGYDLPLAHKVSIGFDAEITGSAAKSRQHVQVSRPALPLGPPFIIPVTDIAVNTSTGRQLYVGGRLTVSVSSKLNLYAKAGYSNLRLTSVATINGSGAPSTGPILGSFAGPPNVGTIPSNAVFVSTSLSASSKLDGINIGVGGQFLIYKNIYTTLEYRYSNYESEVSRNQIIAGVGIRF